MTQQELKEALQAKFIYMDEVIDVVAHCLFHQKHAILFGGGGHAKSAIIETAFRLLLGDERFYQDVYMTACSMEMDSTPFVGYQDIAKLRSGKHEMILDDTIYLSKEFVVLEEGLDMPDYLFQSVKDQLMRGYLCVNGTCHQNKLKVMFICTNHNPNDWAGDDASKQATLARFPFRVEVKWPSYTEKDFLNFMTKLGKPDSLFAKICGFCHSKGVFVSPRDAVHMYEVVQTSGYTMLKNFGPLSKNPAVFAEVLTMVTSAPIYKRLDDAVNLLRAAEEAFKVGDNRAELKFINVKRELKAMEKMQFPVDGKFTGLFALAMKTTEEKLTEIQLAKVTPRV